MEKFKEIISHCPNWLPTILVVGLICWLTLAPHPVGDLDLPLFEGFDKIVHGLMFGGLTIVALFDIMRYRDWQKESLPVVGVVVIISALFGIGVEFIQESMGLGRSNEIYDMIADATGATVFGVIWLLIQPLFEDGNRT